MTEAIAIQLELAKDEAYPGELEEITLGVKAELEQSNILVEETHRVNEDKLGPEWIPILTAILSGPAVLLAIKAIRGVAETTIGKHRHIRITLTRGDEQSILDFRNIKAKDVQKIIDDLDLR